MNVYPLCMDCIRNSDAMTDVTCDFTAICVVCGNNRKACKPAGPQSVNAAFKVYFERLQMALTRAAQK